MAQKVINELVDDIDGTQADETVEFALDGVWYEIDLTNTHAAKLRESIHAWIEYARRTGGRRKRGSGPLAASTTKRAATSAGRASRSTPAKQVDPGAVRLWAKDMGKRVNARGRVPQWLIDEYVAAH